MRNSLAALFFTVFLTSCIFPGDKSPLIFRETVTTVINPVAEEQDKVFLSLQKRIFNVSCIGCHSPKKPKRLDLTKKENVIENFQDIVDRMRDVSGVDTMPPFEDQNIYPAVSEELIVELENWKKEYDLKKDEVVPTEVDNNKPDSESKPENPSNPTENPDEPWL